MRCKGRFERLGDDEFTATDTEILLREIYGMNANRSLDDLLYTGDDDFSFSIPNLGRFRCNAYRQRGSLAAVLRVVSYGLPDPGQLGIPESVLELADMAKGLVFVTGPAGSGKSTTLACMVDRINETRSGHIVTIEDPVEYLHPHKGCIVSQREVRTDAGTFSGAVRSALRQRADVILLGDMPDSSTIQAAVNAAEMGKLVLVEGYIYGLSKLTSALVESIGVQYQPLLRKWLSLTLSAVVIQRLVPTVDGEVEPVFEVIKITPDIRKAIRENGDLSEFETGVDNRIYELWATGRITRDTALAHASDAHRLVSMMDAK